MSLQDDQTRLQHMLESSRKAISFVRGKTIEDLENDEILMLALVKIVEIIGEAASRISREYQNAHPQIPWAAIIGMRNRLVHAYFDINLKILWQTTHKELPFLISELEKLVQTK